jgi:hypothetical protein
MEKFRGRIKSSAEEEKVSLENRDAQQKIRIVSGKRGRRLESQNVSRIFGSLAKKAKVQLKI